MQSLHFAYWVILHAFLSSAEFFFKINLIKTFFQEYHQHVNCLDTDQAWHLVGPDLGPNCCKDYQQMTLVGRLIAFVKIVFVQ